MARGADTGTWRTRWRKQPNSDAGANAAGCGTDGPPTAGVPPRIGGRASAVPARRSRLPSGAAERTGVPPTAARRNAARRWAAVAAAGAVKRRRRTLPKKSPS